MKKTARKTGTTEATRPQLREVLGKLADDQATVQLVLGLQYLVRNQLREFVIGAGTAALAAVLEEERTRLVGPKYAHLPDRQAHLPAFDQSAVFAPALPRDCLWPRSQRATEGRLPAPSRSSWGRPSSRPQG
ncbi:MAG TPA: hypothetical protein VF516_02770, partial [Kofleriaceae bacterium]